MEPDKIAKLKALGMSQKAIDHFLAQAAARQKELAAMGIVSKAQEPDTQITSKGISGPFTWLDQQLASTPSVKAKATASAGDTSQAPRDWIAAKLSGHAMRTKEAPNPAAGGPARSADPGEMLSDLLKTVGAVATEHGEGRASELIQILAEEAARFVKSLAEVPAPAPAIQRQSGYGQVKK